MTVSTWGATLRPMRKRAGLSLRALGEKAGVDFTYLSKIECGTLPPPSTRTIRRIAAVLGGDADEMIAQAGKTDAHYSQRLRDEIAALTKVKEAAGEAFIAYENTQNGSAAAADDLHDRMGRLGFELYQCHHGEKASA